MTTIEIASERPRGTASKYSSFSQNQLRIEGLCWGWCQLEITGMLWCTSFFSNISNFCDIYAHFHFVEHYRLSKPKCETFGIQISWGSKLRGDLMLPSLWSKIIMCTNYFRFQTLVPSALTSILLKTPQNLLYCPFANTDCSIFKLLNIGF